MAGNSVVRSVLLQRDFLAVFVTIVNAFSWYFPLYLFLKGALESMYSPSFLLLAFGIQFVAAVCSAVAGVALVK